MNCEILAIGTELLVGDVVNTNASYLSGRLTELGISVTAHRTVRDVTSEINHALREGLSKNDIIITTGGLGPTQDDLTRQCVADVLGLPLVLDTESEEHIRSFFKARGRTMAESNLKQAMFPKGAYICGNSRGTAPGAICEKESKAVIMLPGPPFEMKTMFEQSIAPWLAQKSGLSIFSRTIKMCGIGESEMESRVAELINETGNPLVAPYAAMGECRLRITARAESAEEARAMAAPVEAIITERLGEYVYGYDNESLEDVVYGLLKKHNLTISLAESCTGGLASGRLVNVSGISSLFKGAVVAYSNEVKVAELGVKNETLKSHGAVSGETVREMAQGAALKFGSDVSLSVSGIAGPGGGSKEKPVGTVYIALYIKDKIFVENFVMPGNREFIRFRTVSYMLNFLIQKLKEIR